MSSTIPELEARIAGLNQQIEESCRQGPDHAEPFIVTTCILVNQMR